MKDILKNKAIGIEVFQAIMGRPKKTMVRKTILKTQRVTILPT